MSSIKNVKRLTRLGQIFLPFGVGVTIGNTILDTLDYAKKKRDQEVINDILARLEDGESVNDISKKITFSELKKEALDILKTYKNTIISGSLLCAVMSLIYTKQIKAFDCILGYTAALTDTFGSSSRTTIVGTSKKPVVHIIDKFAQCEFDIPLDDLLFSEYLFTNECAQNTTGGVFLYDFYDILGKSSLLTDDYNQFGWYTDPTIIPLVNFEHSKICENDGVMIIELSYTEPTWID